MALRVRLLETVEAIRDSYWIVPGLMAAGGLAAALGLVLVDARIGADWLGQFAWFYGSRPEGARAVLSTIASSTITVAGVVFSITLAAVTYASGQYGPRLLSNFQRDRGNQATLGTFVAAFLYCLVVLRTIRTAEEASADSGGAVREAFVPQLAVFGAMALAIASIAVLVFFVHHVTDSIHINNTIARIGQGLIDDVRELPAAEPSAPASKPVRLHESIEVAATETGYVEAIDKEALLSLACRHDLRLRLVVRPGSFVAAGRSLLEASPLARFDPDLAAACNKAFAIGRKRTKLQDLRFSIDELVEIAARALSPGVNDPFTAFACIDWLGAGIAELAVRGKEIGVVLDKEGEPRLILEQLRFADYLHHAFGQLRPYAARDPNAKARLAATLQGIAGRVGDPARRAAILAELDALRQSDAS